MTVQELLKPRFKLMAEYPGCNREVGTISIEEHTVQYFRKYPLNFDELVWYEHREKQELPKYVSYAPKDRQKKILIAKWSISTKHHYAYIKDINMNRVNPATEQEYLDYQNKLKSN